MSRMYRLIAVLIAFAFLAAACGSDDTTETPGGGDPSVSATSDSSEPTSEATSETSGSSATSETSGSTDAPAGNFYEDPRGGIFADFQTGFDRSHPFQSLDDFCLPNEADGALEASAPGITADEFTVVHIRSKLEDFEDIGFGIPVGNVNQMFKVFTDYVNETCGGVRGRTVNLETIEVDVLGADVDAIRNTACVEATEDKQGIIVLNTSGFQGTALLCITEEHKTPMITSQGVNGEWTERSEDRLLSLSPTLEESVRYLGNDLVASGVLEGTTIGVFYPDTPGQPEAMQELIRILGDAGLSVTVESEIGCEGGTTCAAGVQESVTDMLDAGVDVMFPGLNVVSLPGYINEMVAQGFQPGEVQFYNSDFNSQAGDLVSSKIVSFGGEAAGEMYNGAIIVDDADTGFIRDPNSVVSPLNAMCSRIYAENGGEVHDPFDPKASGAGMTTTVCNQLRMTFRAMYDAGDNPSLDDFQNALANLGPVDIQGMLPGSMRPGKLSLPDALHTMVFHYPCPDEGLGFGEENTCINNAPGDEWRLSE